jgi:polyisoprenoid-binding protein YceI
LTAEAASVSTHDASRDNHLRSAEFFDADHYPVLRFEGTRLEPHRDHYHLHGALTIRGTTRPITLKVEYPALVVDFHGQTKAGFTVEGKLSRKAYGLTWSVLTEAGVVVVGDEVKILAEIHS